MTKKPKLDSVMTLSRLRSLQFLMGLVFLYYLLVITQFPVLFRFLENQHHRHHRTRFLTETPNQQKPHPRFLSNLAFRDKKPQNSTIYSAATKSWIQGTILWSQLITFPAKSAVKPPPPMCPDAVSVSGSDLKYGFVGFPCGLAVGSHVTVMGKPRRAHVENVRRVLDMNEVVMVNNSVSQFMLELRTSAVVGKTEEAARLMHFNPRIKGDWSGKEVIETNNCYRGQWGSAVRCRGWRSHHFEHTVDGQVKCEEWIRNNDTDVNDSVWLNKLMGRQRKKEEIDLRYPFSEDKFFVLTIVAGLEGYHISVDGRHISSFAYRTGSDLEDAMLLYIFGDVDVHSVFAANLPSSHPGFGPERHLVISEKWKARPLPHKPVILFIGIISSGDHFAERMAVRKSWMQHYFINSSIAVARFFVALHEKVEINAELKKEAEFFGDIIIVPYLDNYDLVVLKTLAICEYGVNMLSAKYIMKCDDDSFVRIDAVIDEATLAISEKSLYVGKINFYHKPLRKGKWAVTYEEWPGEVYPPYADGAGYMISSDIARFIVSEFEKSKLRLFKMEDVSMGMWVEQFNSSRPVEYVHSMHFHQSGCVDGYHTAHYQSPRQLICLWDILQSEGIPRCCKL